MIEIRLADLSRVALEPRDVLVVRSPHVISHDQAIAIRAALQQHFPDNDAVILGDGIELAVIRLPDGERIEVVPAAARDDGSWSVDA